MRRPPWQAGVLMVLAALVVVFSLVALAVTGDDDPEPRKTVTTLVVTCDDAGAHIAGPKDGDGVVIAVVDPACVQP